MLLAEWAARWGVPPYALAELNQHLGLELPPCTPKEVGQSEAAALNEARLKAAEAGILTFRNNVGAFVDPRGALVRYGLANESKAMNAKIKSGDLVGIRPLLISPELVGHTVGVFWSREVKRPGWRYSGQGREAAQKTWVDLINKAGGDAGFTDGSKL